MGYLGDFPVGGVVRVAWNTWDGQDSPATPSDAGIIRIYKNGSNTERNSMSGITETIDFDATIGEHLIEITLSDDTDPGFWAAGGEYTVKKFNAIVDGTTISATLDTFSIERTGGALALLKSGTFGLAAAKTAIDVIVGKVTPLPTDPADHSILLAAIEAIPGGGGSGGLTAPQAAQLTAIEGKVNALPTDPADQSLIIAATDAIMARLGIPSSSVSADIASSLSSIMTRLGVPLLTSISQDIAAITASTSGGLTLEEKAQLTAIANSILNPAGFKINTAVPNFDFPMFTTAGVPKENPVNLVAKRRIDSGVYALCANAPAYVSNNMCSIDLAASDMNGNKITFLFTADGCRPTIKTIFTEP